MKLEVFDIIPDLKEPIGYKLYWLLKLRALIPATTPEMMTPKQILSSTTSTIDL